MNALPFKIERRFEVPIGIVWDALTNNEKLKQWYFKLPEFKPVKGFEFSFLGGADEKKPYNHLCQITAVIPGKKLAYTWRYEGMSGISEVIFELFDDGTATRLILTHKGLESFSESGPDFAKSNFEMGWTSILDQSLKAFLQKN